ncbi:hypothetical protein DFJ58DRAFT_763737 [Suillus subalutaceus]|uniref:uncharacterized protein n=1 Tax=Suillus subalutaceus TaxID=48586 RepID=UPI001B869094|nr:uncharacterized protein DFJ58DRAFT_763737 [Suillus subalutaceus]KAG1870601.1 hypothetical protein DFJ58DRAFT_763737 [Suillus subalutaceus]
MKFTTVFVALVSAVPAVFGLTVNTPADVVECQPVLFSWSGGVPPYYLTLVPGGQSMASPIKSFPTQTGTSYTWNVDLQANTIFNIALKDSTGTTAYSDIVTIMSGSDTSCVNTAVNEGGSSSGSAVASGTSTPTAGSSASASGATSSGVKTSATTTASSGTTQKTGAASSLSVSSAMGVAGVMGLIGAALF